MKRAIALAVSVAAVHALTGTAGSTAADVWAKLHRPIHIPHIPLGSTCPTSKPNMEVDFASYGVGQGYGPGPAFPIFPGTFADQPGLSVRFPPDAFRGSRWGGAEASWLVLPNHGRVLVRGRRLDGADKLRFGRARVPTLELRLRGRPTHRATTRFRVAGCYGYQIDGPSFSRIIVFLAVPYDQGRHG